MIWSHLALIWSHSGLQSLIWSHLGLQNLIWSHLGFHELPTSVSTCLIIFGLLPDRTFIHSGPWAAQSPSFPSPELIYSSTIAPFRIVSAYECTLHSKLLAIRNGFGITPKGPKPPKVAEGALGPPLVPLGPLGSSWAPGIGTL